MMVLVVISIHQNFDYQYPLPKFKRKRILTKFQPLPPKNPIVVSVESNSNDHILLPQPNPPAFKIFSIPSIPLLLLLLLPEFIESEIRMTVDANSILIILPSGSVKLFDVEVEEEEEEWEKGSCRDVIIGNGCEEGAKIICVSREEGGRLRIVVEFDIEVEGWEVSILPLIEHEPNINVILYVPCRIRV